MGGGGIIIKWVTFKSTVGPDIWHGGASLLCRGGEGGGDIVVSLPEKIDTLNILVSDTLLHLFLFLLTYNAMEWGISFMVRTVGFHCGVRA